MKRSSAAALSGPKSLPATAPYDVSPPLRSEIRPRATSDRPLVPAATTASTSEGSSMASGGFWNWR